MDFFANMHPASVVIIVLTLALFVAAVIVLFVVTLAYRRLAKFAVVGDTHRCQLVRDAQEEFSSAYKTFGQETNTPAIVTSVIHTDLGFYLFCERFLSNAVSLFVTLGLLGTFLGLSMSVSSLSELLGSTEDWQAALNNMGSGLLSALSGMGVAFYTSLVGVSCSIILTLLRSIFSPESAREQLENELELWLDHRVAPRLSTDVVTDDSQLISRLIESLNDTTDIMDNTLSITTSSLQKTMAEFNKTVDTFNHSVRDFSEFDYNLRGTVEKMDVAVRDLTAAIRRVTRSSERSDQQ